MPASSPAPAHNAGAMRTIYYDVWRRGGVARTYELLGDGPFG